METNKFTEGKWNYDSSVSIDYFPIYNDNGSLIAEVNTHRPITGLISGLSTDERDEFEANAKLICAAPNLLEQLESALNEIGSLNTVLYQHHIEIDWVKQRSKMALICDAIKEATE